MKFVRTVNFESKYRGQTFWNNSKGFYSRYLRLTTWLGLPNLLLSIESSIEFYHVRAINVFRRILWWLWNLRQGRLSWSIRSFGVNTEWDYRHLFLFFTFQKLKKFNQISIFLPRFRARNFRHKNLFFELNFLGFLYLEKKMSQITGLTALGRRWVFWFNDFSVFA